MLLTSELSPRRAAEEAEVKSKRFNPFSCAIWALYLLMAAVPAFASPARLGEADEKKIVRAAYASLARLSAASGREFRVRLTSFHTIEPAEFATVLWWETVTPPGGDMVDMSRQAHSVDGSLAAIHYEPKWQFDGPDYLKPDAPAEVTLASIADVLADRRRGDAQLGDAIAVTAFDVRVEFDGHAREYKAAAIWLLPTGAIKPQISLVDNITQGVQQAIEEPAVRPRTGPVSLPTKTNECEPSSWANLHQKITSDATGHLYGAHHAFAEVAQVCDCSSSCYQTCRADFRQKACWDDGETDNGCHQMNSLEAASTATAVDGSVDVAKCAAGFQCREKTCAFCWCNVSVGVSAQGGSVQFQAASGENWGADLAFENLECPRCQRVSYTGRDGSYDPYNRDPGPWPSSGGFCCTSWATNCYWDASRAEYVCTIDTSRCLVYRAC